MKKTMMAGALTLLGAAASMPALAHPAGAMAAAGFEAGLIHPFTGIDHLLAMLAVGIWSVRQPRGHKLPPVFLAAMLAGALSGVAGLAIPGLETGIAVTVALIGCLIALAARLPAAVSVSMIALCAALHGNAHGHELPQVASAAGFLAASAVLMLAGRWFGRVATAGLVRLAGAGIAATGVLLVALN
ncbi:MAG: HupE/UreJ family protein [Pseudomonadota bacterium]